MKSIADCDVRNCSINVLSNFLDCVIIFIRMVKQTEEPRRNKYPE